MKLFIALLMAASAWCGTIHPAKSVKTSSPVLDFVVHGKTVMAGTENGEILRMDDKGKILSTFTLKASKSAYGDVTVPRVMSLDVSADGTTTAIASEEGKIYLLRGKELKATSYTTPAVIKKVFFVSDTRLMIALLSNEIVWFDLPSDSVLKTLSIGTSPLSDLAISKDRKTAVTAGEAGVVAVLDTAGMKVIRKISGGNVDNVYKLDLQNDKIATAGQDRRAIVYTVDGKRYVRYNGTFLIYAVALSPSASVLAAAMDEENVITLFDTKTHRLIDRAVGHQSTLNRIGFIDERHFVSSADENKILFWELP